MPAPSMEVTRMKFQRPRFMLRKIEVPREPRQFALVLPAMTNIYDVCPKGDYLSMTVLVPLDETLGVENRKFFLIQEGQEFEVEETDIGPTILPDGTVEEECYTPVFTLVSMWEEEIEGGFVTTYALFEGDSDPE